MATVSQPNCVYFAARILIWILFLLKVAVIVFLNGYYVSLSLSLPLLLCVCLCLCVWSITAFTVFRSSSPAAKEVSAEDILIAEGTATLQLADKQAEEGMHKEAARNYHTATVYFRVLESMVPRLTSRVHDSLNYAASRTQQSSHLLQNLVHEHFEGLRYVRTSINL